MPRSENRNDWDRAAMERMSTADLEELLLQDFHAPERGKQDMSGLYQAAQVLAEREPEASAAADRAWENFREKYLPFVADGSPLSEDGAPPSSDAAPRRRHTALRRWGIRAAVAAAAALLSLSIAAAAGHGMNGLRALWTDEQIWLTPSQLVPVGRDELTIPEEPGDYAGLQEALEDYGLTLQAVPRWLPEGFELRDLFVDDQGGDMLIFHAAYARDDGFLVMNVMIHLEGEDIEAEGLTNFQKDEGAPVPYKAGGVTHMLAVNAGRPVAVWACGPAECGISGDITMEELERIIDSIYQQQPAE